MPIWRDGEVVGAIGLSGLSSAADWNLPTLGPELISDARVFVYREGRV
ncbi:MAG: hypothetical protein DMG82_22455 [Acidobacteria bacterium]|nr:MAG: hypothetical protein DMG82_22455 [Acidobacteriota bacterium]PYX43098.1 MAG: hypothetical protein DMG83_18680 [Acidobacteriota bacterium]